MPGIKAWAAPVTKARGLRARKEWADLPDERGCGGIARTARCPPPDLTDEQKAKIKEMMAGAKAAGGKTGDQQGRMKAFKGKFGQMRQRPHKAATPPATDS